MRTALLLLFPALLAAQETVAPTVDEKVGTTRGTDRGGYNIIQNWELGYRFASLGGDQTKYRSDVNYGNGIRLLSSYLSLNSKDGKGRLFDELTISTLGLGNDPYQSAQLRLQKNRWYRYDLLWRQNDYRNAGLVLSAGTHAENTTRRWQDHDLTLFPQSHVRIMLGYSRVKQTGPALVSDLEFDSRGDVYSLFRNTQRQFDDYRLGADATFKGFRFTVQRRWEFYKEDTRDNRALAVLGTPPSALTSFNRSAPYRGQTPGWLGNIYGEQKWLVVNGRITYASTVGDFIQNEAAIGTDRFGAAANRQILVRGRGIRPVVTGDGNVIILPNSRLTITHHIAISNTRMVGNNFYRQFDNSTLSFETLAFQNLSLRLITNSTDARFRISKRFDVFGGYRYSDRRIYSVESSQAPGFPADTATGEQLNHTKAGLAGFNLVPVKNLRLHIESEFGTNDNPFTPVSLRDYHAVRAKGSYRTKKYSFGGAYADNYNNNSVSVTAYSSKSRNYSAEGSIAAKSWVSIDGSYSKLHIDTAGGLNFFAGAPRPQLISNIQSVYVSNIHAGNLGLRFALKKYADLYAGYSITRDAGDGRATNAAQATLATTAFYRVQTFPLTYQSPIVRLSVRLTDKLRWNAGWQYYGYNEDFGLLGLNQGYRANTGYTSLLWAF